MTLKTSKLCNSNLNSLIKVKLYTNKDSKPLGEVTMTVNQLTKNSELSILDIETAKEVCKLLIGEIVPPEPDFLQYV